jgi:hypothetical protein
MHQEPVDPAPVRAALAKEVADNLERFRHIYPNGRRPGAARMSGDRWLCECSLEELEANLAARLDRLSWRWNALPS